MNTLTNGLLKRALSILLVTIMVFSLGIVGVTSTSAAEVEFEDTGYNVDKNFYCLNSFTQGDDMSKWKADSSVKMTKKSSNELKITLNDVPTSKEFKFVIYTDDNGDYRQGDNVATPSMGYDFGLSSSSKRTLSECAPLVVKFTNVQNYSTVDMEIIFKISDNDIRVGFVSGSTSGGNTGGDPIPAKTVYFDNSGGNWSNAYAYYWITTTNAPSGAWPGKSLTDADKVDVTLSNGTTLNVYKVSLPESIIGLIFNNNAQKTADITNIKDGMVYKFHAHEGAPTEVGTATESGGTDNPVVPGATFWADTNANHTTNTNVASSIDPLDWIYPRKSGSTYYLYLPSNVDITKVPLYVTDTAVLTLKNGSNTQTITGTGSASATAVDLSAETFTLGGGSISGTLKVLKSANVYTIYTETAYPVPDEIAEQENDCGKTIDPYNKDSFEVKDGFVLITDENGKYLSKHEVKDANGNKVKTAGDMNLSKIKGRGNSSWEASARLIGKYAFNITLGNKIKLLGNDSSKKYCLVSFNADQARMRNMLVYDLSEKIGIEFTPAFKPVDFYNNGQYIGSYLLTDKVEIGEPLVTLSADLDKINEEYSLGNEEIYGYNSEQLKAVRKCVGSNNIDDSTTPNYYKYVNIEDPGREKYEESGFLLELELVSRFKNEISGFISNKGQQVVCKYPEYASNNQMEFILGVWNEAEARIYDGIKEGNTYRPATYAELSEVIDVESFAKMYLIQELTKNLDTCATSYYVFYEGGKLHAGVTWDYDWALGQYGNTYNSRVKTTTFFNEVSDKFESPEGWWASIKEIYDDNDGDAASTYNIQAQLCQNDAFWNVVKAEWNELFFATASTYVTNGYAPDDNPNTTLNGIDGFYDMISASTKMDESRWGQIATNSLNDWGSVNAATTTPATHKSATEFLNDWVYERLNWMNETISSDDYTLATPELALSSEVIDLGQAVTITATCKSSGNLTYTLCDADGNPIAGVNPLSTIDGEVQFTYTPTAAGLKDLTVKVTSTNTSKASSSVVEQLEIMETEFNLTVTLNGCGDLIESPTPHYEVTAPYNHYIYFNATNNYKGTDKVTYFLMYSDSLDGEYECINANAYVTTGYPVDHKLSVSDYPESAGNTNYYKIVAKIWDADGKCIDEAESYPVVNNVTDYAFDVKLTASAVSNGKFTLTASVPDFSADFTDTAISYIFYDSTGAEIHQVKAVKGTYTVTVPENTFGTFEYSVRASVSGNLYNNPDYAYSYPKAGSPGTASTTVTIQDTSAPVNVVFKFKAPDTLAYQPNLTVTVAGEKVADNVKLGTDRTLITINKNQTASYYWYSYTLEDVKNTSTLNFTVKATRNYFYSGVAEFKVADTTDFELSQDGKTYTYYFALENLNYGGNSPLVNVTKLDQPIAEGSNVLYRDVTLNIANMISGPEAQADLVASGYTFRAADFGDANCDGKINIKDATYVQKSLANIVVADDLSTIVSDVTGDGKVTIKDATAIQKQLAGL